MKKSGKTTRVKRTNEKSHAVRKQADISDKEGYESDDDGICTFVSTQTGTT